MVSERKLAANRSNARRCSGPSTAAGKRRVGQNAFRHGLAVRILSDPAKSAEVERLAVALAGTGADAFRIAQARIAAEAELELIRVRNIRAALINSMPVEPATARLPLARSSSAGSQDTTPGQQDRKGREVDRFIRALPLLVRIDRYELRALSRRKRALRSLAAEVK
jgi:hypothetical protein